MISFSKTISTWRHYLLGKRGELAQIDHKDAYMAKVVMDIHRKRIGKHLTRVPLAQLDPIHLIDRESAMRTMHERAEALRARRDALLTAKLLDSDALQAIMPSISQIKVVRDGDRWLAFEGNGRLYAMHEVFSAEDGMQVDVEEYLFDNPRSLQRRLHRVRRLNRLT
jgi:hypothetical protein